MSFEVLKVVYLVVQAFWNVTLCCWMSSSDVLKDCCGFVVKVKASLFSGLCDPEDDGTMIV